MKATRVSLCWLLCTSTGSIGIASSRQHDTIIPSPITAPRSSSNSDPRLSSLRGGGTESPSSNPATKTPLSVSAVGTAVVDMAVSAYLVATETANKHVLPILKDPYLKIWIQTKRFLQEQEEAAIDRRLSKRRTGTLRDQHVVIPEILSSAPRQPQDSSTAVGSVAEPTASISSPTRISKKRSRNTSDKVGPQHASSSTPSLSLVLLPKRLCKLSLAAWLLAEALDRIGILQEETPAALRSQFHRVWCDLQPRFSDLQLRLQSAWRDVAPRGFKGIPSKYQFAVGAGVGMVVSPLFLSWTAIVWQPTLLVYGLSELHARLKASGRWSLEVVFNESVAGKIDRELDRVRHSIRTLMLHHPSSSPHNQTLLLTGGSRKSSYHLSGYPSVAASRSSRSSAKKELTVFFWRSSTRTQQLHASSTNTRSMTHHYGTSDDCEEKHRMKEMLRHGFLVGGMVGLLGGL